MLPARSVSTASPASTSQRADELVRGILLGRIADPGRPDRVQIVEPLEDPAHRPNGFDGREPVAVITDFVSR